MDVLKHFIIFYFCQNILLFLVLLISEIKDFREYKKDLLKLKALINSMKFIFLGVPLIVYESIKDNY